MSEILKPAFKSFLISFVFFFLLNFAAYVMEIHLQTGTSEEWIMNEFWETIFGSVLPSIIVSAITTALTYFIFLRKMPDRIIEKLERKIDPSNQTIYNQLTPSNQVLSEKIDKSETLLVQVYGFAQSLSDSQKEIKHAAPDVNRGIQSILSGVKQFNSKFEKLEREYQNLQLQHRQLEHNFSILEEKNNRLHQQHEELKRENAQLKQKLNPSKENLPFQRQDSELDGPEL